jgi:hypothetical protein
MSGVKSATDAVKFLADQSIKVAKVAADLDSTQPGSAMQRALIQRSQIMMDCAKMIAEWNR